MNIYNMLPVSEPAARAVSVSDCRGVAGTVAPAGSVAGAVQAG